MNDGRGEFNYGEYSIWWNAWQASNLFPL
jgi:hypothetical protein